jgi:hypothetical protein
MNKKRAKRKLAKRKNARKKRNCTWKEPSVLTRPSKRDRREEIDEPEICINAKKTPLGYEVEIGVGYLARLLYHTFGTRGMVCQGGDRGAYYIIESAHQETPADRRTLAEYNPKTEFLLTWPIPAKHGLFDHALWAIASHPIAPSPFISIEFRVESLECVYQTLSDKRFLEEFILDKKMLLGQE